MRDRRLIIRRLEESYPLANLSVLVGQAALDSSVTTQSLRTLRGAGKKARTLTALWPRDVVCGERQIFVGKRRMTRPAFKSSMKSAWL